MESSDEGEMSGEEEQFGRLGPLSALRARLGLWPCESWFSSSLLNRRPVAYSIALSGTYAEDKGDTGRGGKARREQDDDKDDDAGESFGVEGEGACRD